MFAFMNKIKQRQASTNDKEAKFMINLIWHCLR